jgi:hypothetical protein
VGESKWRSRLSSRTPARLNSKTWSSAGLDDAHDEAPGSYGYTSEAALTLSALSSCGALRTSA